MENKKQKNSSGFITDLHDEYGIYDKFLLTQYGSLIGAIELGGRDADSLLMDDHLGLAHITRNIYEKVDKSIIITQYFSHFDQVKIELEKRDYSISNTLSERLKYFLNSKNLTSSHLIHYFEIFPANKLNNLKFWHTIRHLLASPFSKTSWSVIKEKINESFGHHAALIVQLEELDRQVIELKKTLNEVTAKWGSIMSAKICDIQEIWAHKRFLATLDASLLKEGLNEHCPASDWDKTVQSGDIKQVIIQNTDMLKIHGTKTRYARIASIIGFGDKQVLPGIWSMDDAAPLKLNCNFIAMMRWSPINAFERALLFKSKKDEVARSNLNMGDLLSGKQKSELDKHLSMKPAIEQKVKELNEAENVVDSWGLVHASFLIFNEDPTTILENSIQVDKAFGGSGMRVVWETLYLPDSFKTMQLSGGQKSQRDIYFTSTQLGAASLIYKSSEGQKTIKFASTEEAQYIFQTTDGSTFHYSPFVGGKSLEIGTGVTRSGKSFLKNTIDGHFLKYGGLLRAIDIDPGTEMLAKVFGDDGSVFKLSEGMIQGLNLFASAKSQNDRGFIKHLRIMLLGMLAANDQIDLRTLKEDEQDYLDKAIRDTMALPKEMQRLGTLVQHMPKSLSRKFTRWVYQQHETGMYADLFDAAIDSIGTLDKRIAVCNLQGISQDHTALALVMMDYFYRVTSSFENEDFRDIPKKLAIDEAHHILAYPEIADYVVKKIRTWGKYFGGISLWTQSPEDYLKIPNWSAVQSSATSFIFTADPAMKQDLYQKAFGLTDGECAQIRNLQPKREAYIVQPELGISKKVILEVDRYQYVISTSDPVECTIRNKLINQYGFEEGIQSTIDVLDAKNITTVNQKALELEKIKQQYYGT
ncbi:MAG: hypothetical protein ABI370_12205 [Gammaproteobacteria bacterium]